MAADRHLTGLAEWTTPTAGMFAWIKLNGVEDSEQLIMQKAIDEKVLMVPGTLTLTLTLTLIGRCSWSQAPFHAQPPSP